MFPIIQRKSGYTYFISSKKDGDGDYRVVVPHYKHKSIYIYIIHSHDYAWFDTFYPVIVGDILYPLRTFKNHIDGIRPWLLWIPQTEPTDRH